MNQTPSSPVLEYVVKPEESGQRLDLFLLNRGVLPSRKKIKKLLDQGGVRESQRLLRIASWSVSTGNEIKVSKALRDSILSPATSTFHKKNLTTLYEDEHILAIHKPAGLLSQQPPPKSQESHVLEVLQEPNLKLIHRLDRETSGVLLLTKTKEAYHAIRSQWHKQTIKKTYLALVNPIPKISLQKSSWNATSHLSKNPGSSGQIIKTTPQQGRWACTEFSLLSKNTNYDLALLKCTPITGRTHQIRLHLSDQGSSLVGDKLYGTGSWHQLPEHLSHLAAQRHMLHAHSLELKIPPTEKPTHITAPLSGAFSELCEKLKLKQKYTSLSL